MGRGSDTPQAPGRYALSRKNRRDGFCGNSSDVLHNGQYSMAFYLVVSRSARISMHISFELSAKTVATSSMG